MGEKIEPTVLSDGRRAEFRVKDDGETRIVETLAEPKLPKKLENRVIEKRRPVVVERTVQNIDPESGVIKEEIVESIDPPESKMQKVRHIVSEATEVSAMSLKENDCDCVMSKEEVIETVVAAVKALKEDNSKLSEEDYYAEEPKKRKVSAMQTMVGERAEQSNKKESNVRLIVLSLIAAEIAALAYIVFVM